MGGSTLGQLDTDACARTRERATGQSGAERSTCTPLTWVVPKNHGEHDVEAHEDHALEPVRLAVCDDVAHGMYYVSWLA